MLIRLGIRSSTLGEATRQANGDIITAALTAALIDRFIDGMTVDAEAVAV